ncbi:MAG: 16S rRNA processing protein RimM [Deltaproteobacteria bacterium]|nr:16S rRNA processing protein RimM [Deltaproteobacteria bacterium]MBW2396923.1 16S rRNA processing protein RimM [Deltaproteobacteria bacterium]
MVGAHGLSGEIRVRVYGDGPDNLLEAGEIALADPERGAEDPAPRHYEIERGGAGRSSEVRLKLAGVADREAAAALSGRLVTVPATALPELPEDEFYGYQLVGCEVVTEAGDIVGRVQQVWETGAHDVLMVRDERGRRHLIPTAREFLTDINLTEGRLTVATRPGLLEED